MFAALPHPVRPRGEAARIARAFTTLLRSLAPVLRCPRRDCAILSMHISTTDLFASIWFSLTLDKNTLKICLATIKLRNANNFGTIFTIYKYNGVSD